MIWSCSNVVTEPLDTLLDVMDVLGWNAALCRGAISAQNGANMICESPKNAKEFKNAWQISISTIGIQWYKNQIKKNQLSFTCVHCMRKYTLWKQKIHEISIPIYFFPIRLQSKKMTSTSRILTFNHRPTPSTSLTGCQGALKPSPYIPIKKQQIQAFFSFWNFCCGATNNTEKTASSYYNFGKAQRAFFRRNNCYCCWFLRGSKLPKRLPPLHTWTLMLKKLGKTVCNACSCS